MTLKTLLEKAAPSLLATAVVAGATATYQFAQMRVEVEALKAGQARVEAKVDALMSRFAWYHGAGEQATVERMARIGKQPATSGVAFAEEIPDADPR